MVFLLALLVLACFFAWLGWRLSAAALIPEAYWLNPEFTIIDYQEGIVTLPVPPNKKQFSATNREGYYALLWEEGIGKLGSVIEQDDMQLSRKLELISGEAPTAGVAARLDSFVFRRNPKEDHDINYQALWLEGQVGKLESWWMPQHPEKAILMLHGRRRGYIAETQRILPTLHTMGYSVLSLSYRNHSESAMSPDGFFHYGASEWQDAMTGLEYLAEQGIKDVLIYGFSMGGAVTLETLKRLPKENLPEVKAIVMDAPLLDPRSVFTMGAKKAKLPLADLLTNWGLQIAKWRSGVNWDELDQRKFASQINLPVLLFMGTADSTIPIDLVDDFAAQAPNIDYVRLNGVEHVEAWNVNPEAYDAKVQAFLKQNYPLD